MTSTFAPTSLTLAGGTADEIVFSAPSNDNLFLSGDSAGGVDLVGVANLTCSTAFNQGTPLAGLCMAFGGSRLSATAGFYTSYGNLGTTGGAIATGFMMPIEGTIITWTIMSDTAITATFELVVNGSGTGNTISLTASSSNVATLNYAFNADDDITTMCTAGPGSSPWAIFLFIRFGT